MHKPLAHLLAEDLLEALHLLLQVCCLHSTASSGLSCQQLSSVQGSSSWYLV